MTSTPRFSIEGAVVGIDDRTGDVVVYAGNGAASFSHSAWWPGVWFNKSHMLGFTALRTRRRSAII